jgi:hypothetical protein
MKNLKKFEEFENNPNFAKYQLEDDQVDDLHEQFENFLEDMEKESGDKLSYDEILDFFIVDDQGKISDDFVRFLDYLESNTDWFDFKMMDKVKNDLEIILSNMEYDYEEEEEDTEWAQDDPEWPYEKSEETGEFADPQDEEEDEIEQLRQKTYSKEPQLNVDEILDKISASGYESLTDEEKEFLSKQESRIVRFGNFKK